MQEMMPNWVAAVVYGSDSAVGNLGLAWSAGVGLLFVATGYFLVRQFRQRARIGGGADTAPWDAWAMALGHTATINTDRAMVSGIHAGRPFTLQAEVWVTHSQEGGEHRHARSTMRVPHRGSVPPSFTVHAPTGVGGRLFAKLLGAPIVRTVPEVDRVAVVECRDAALARALMEDAALRQHILRLMEQLPEAVVHNRGTEVSLRSMMTDVARLEQTLSLFAAIADRLEALAPPHEEASRPRVPGPSDAPLRSSADLGPRRDTMADVLNRSMTRKALGAFDTGGRAAGALPFEVKITRVTEVEDRYDATRLRPLVEGELLRSSFRLKIQWDDAHAGVIAALEPGQIVMGEGYIDEVEVRRYRALVTASSVPIPVEM